MANIDERPNLTREAVEQHKDNRVTTIVAGLIIVVAMIAALAFLMNRDRVNNDANALQTTAAQDAGAQAAQANANAATANLQAQAAAANTAAAHAQNAAEQGAARGSVGIDGSGGPAVSTPDTSAPAPAPADSAQP
jgi:cytoskeletal protein RodZ